MATFGHVAQVLSSVSALAIWHFSFVARFQLAYHLDNLEMLSMAGNLLSFELST